MWVTTDLFRSRGTENDGVFSTDEYFVLDAHPEAMKVFRELRIGRDIHTYGRRQLQNAGDVEWRSMWVVYTYQAR
jgi:hypothetical protein